MEKRRIRLEIDGVVCGLITEESDEYMESLAHEVQALMQAIRTASPYITMEAAALTAALSYCDDLRKSGERLQALTENAAAPAESGLKEALEALKEENAALSAAREADGEKARALAEENRSLRAELSALRREADALRSESAAGETVPYIPRGEHRNPFRQEAQGSDGMVSFFEKP